MPIKVTLTMGHPFVISPRNLWFRRRGISKLEVDLMNELSNSLFIQPADINPVRPVILHCSRVVAISSAH